MACGMAPWFAYIMGIIKYEWDYKSREFVGITEVKVRYIKDFISQET